MTQYCDVILTAITITRQGVGPGLLSQQKCVHSALCEQDIHFVDVDIDMVVIVVFDSIQFQFLVKRFLYKEWLKIWNSK